MTLPAVAGRMLESLYQHRVLSTQQLHDLHRPDTDARWTRVLLTRLHDAGLTQSVRAAHGLLFHHLTRAGTEAVELIATRTERRRRLISSQMAAGPLQAHTWAVNQTGICFVKAARERGDECGPLAWRHEISHPTNPLPGQRGGMLVIADAALSYIENDPDGITLHTLLIELDRATEPSDLLARKLARYADVHAYTPKGAQHPAWTEHYDQFPTVLCVLTGGTRAALLRRKDTVLALLATSPKLTSSPQVQIRLGLLEDLATQGAFHPCLHTPADPDQATDWRGHAA